MSRKASIIISAVLGVIVALWMWTIIVPKNALSIGGSTSVDPIMQRLTNTYKKKANGDSFVYSSSGSRGGVKNVDSGTYKIGFISKELTDDLDVVNNNNDINNYNSDKQDYDTIYNYLIKTKNENSDNKKMHHVKIADDAILLTYIAPKDFEDNFGNKFNIELDNGEPTSKWKDIIKFIYSGEATWREIAKKMDISDNEIKEKLIDKNNDKKIVPFARETGSGTRNTFDNKFGLIGDPNRPSSKATEFNSNGMMFTSLKMNTFGYISMNYLEAAKDTDDISFVKIDNQDPESENFNPEIYSFKRPYIGLFQVELKNNDLMKIAKFLAWISNDDDKLVSEQYKIEGLIHKFELDK